MYINKDKSPLYSICQLTHNVCSLFNIYVSIHLAVICELKNASIQTRGRAFYIMYTSSCTCHFDINASIYLSVMHELENDNRSRNITLVLHISSYVYNWQ
jgi:hypothetical protein